MARPLRIDYPDIYYHVLSRGNEQRPIFKSDNDYEMFLELLEKTGKKFHLEIHAYVLMKNHYHLLVRTTQGNLSRAIQWLGVTYAGWFNRKYKRSGHLFQGRYKSFLIEDDKYFTAMCYYIHGNPVRAGIAKTAEQYRWSSARAYSEKKAEPPWLITEVMLSMTGGSRKKFSREQESYLAGSDSPLSDLRHGVYLGSEEYGQQCSEMARGVAINEKPQKRLLLRQRSPKQTAREILEMLGEKAPEDLFVSRKKKRSVRDLCIYVMSRLGIYTHKEIGEIFNVKYTAISGSIKRAELLLQNNKQQKSLVDRTMNDFI
jgi:REP element-mobilizing transposase RayT